MQRVTSFLIHIALLLAGLWSVYGLQLWSQQASFAPPTSFEAKLASMTSRAALVFVGQVIATERRGGVVAVTFRVDQAVAGEAGGTFTLREWAGLWPQGLVRYAVGERAFVFLLGTSAAGFATPVDGAEGVVPVLVQGADAPALLDTRRLAASLQRFPGTPLATPNGGSMQLSSAVAAVQAEIARETAAGHGKAKVSLRVGVPQGLAGQAGGAPSSVATGHLATRSEPILRREPRVVSTREVLSGGADETR